MNRLEVLPRSFIRSLTVRSAFGLPVHVAASQVAPFSTSLGMTGIVGRFCETPAAAMEVFARRLTQTPYNQALQVQYMAWARGARPSILMSRPWRAELCGA